jgi:hypothetical protein
MSSSASVWRNWRKQSAHNTDVERFNLKMISEMEIRKQFQIELSNKFAALENLKW